MPPALVHCRTCRALLNPDLQFDTVEVPVFVPLEEIAAMIEVEPVGFYVGCPNCGQELRVNRKYAGQRVQCKFCEKPFALDLVSERIHIPAIYTGCPHCQMELRVARKYLGQKVACKHCGGQIHLVDRVTA